MTKLLQGQRAIVTGAGRGLGRAIAETLVVLGAEVVVCSRNEADLDEVVRCIAQAGRRVVAWRADVTDEGQVSELVKAAERQVGRPTILVNNAGVLDPIVPLLRSDEAQWLRNLTVNVGGTYLMTRAVLPGMVAQEFGRIVNITSGAAQNPIAGWSAYCTSKAAINQLTRTLARELESSGVTVCALHPGLIDTAMQQRIRGTPVEDFPRVDEFVQYEKEGRLQDPRVPARFVAYLASSTANYNGAVLSVDDTALQQAVTETVGFPSLL